MLLSHVADGNMDSDTIDDGEPKQFLGQENALAVVA